MQATRILGSVSVSLRHYRILRQTQEPRLETYPFLTPSVEIKKAIFMGFPRKQFWTGFLSPLPYRLGGHHAFEGSLARRQT
jgi:hypothetical protein